MDRSVNPDTAREKLIIRPIQEKDLPQISRIEAKIFSDPWSEQAFQESIHLEYTLFLAAECEGEIAGYCGCYLSLDEAEITNVAVKEECRGQGIAKAMLQELLRQGIVRGAKSFFLEVRAGNRPAICLYEKMGFEHSGVRRNFYEHPREDAYIMWKRFPES